MANKKFKEVNVNIIDAYKYIANLKIVPNYCGEKPSLSKYKMQKIYMSLQHLKFIIPKLIHLKRTHAYM